MLVIHSNGGGKPQPIEALFARLESDTLDRSFEAFGDFMQRDPISVTGEPLGPPGMVSIFGNFLTYSHVFSIWTDDEALIEKLAALIAANKARDEYQDQPPPFDKRKLEIVRHRYSVTQGEVSLIYDGRKLGQWGDKIELSHWGWRGICDDQWVTLAKRTLADEHAAMRRRLRREVAA